MKRIYPFLGVILLSLCTFASREQVPSNDVLANYSSKGQVCVCIFVPDDMACNDIVLSGAFNNWSRTISECPVFKPVEGYDGWFVTSFKPETNPDAEKGIQAKPIILDVDGNPWNTYTGANSNIVYDLRVDTMRWARCDEQEEPIPSEWPKRCGENLWWTINTVNGTLTVTGSGDMTVGHITDAEGVILTDGPHWATYLEYIVRVSLPEGLTSIADYSFGCIVGSGMEICPNLTSIVIPGSVTRIGNRAFSTLKLNASSYSVNSALSVITCKAVNPPTLGEDVFVDVDTKSCILYVPSESINAYKTADQWKDFKNIYSLQAEEVIVDQSTAEPTSNSVVVEWPKDDSADTYTIDIKKGDKYVCSLEFNADGQLETIIYAAPSRNAKTRHAQEALQTSTGWQYTINGLDANTEYTYIVTAKKGENVVYEYSVPFKTQDAATGIDTINPTPESAAHKLLRNGQIHILRGDCTYTLTGAEVK